MALPIDYDPTPEQRLGDAREHVARVTEFYGRHSATSCPPNSRAMCDYAELIDPATGQLSTED